MDKYYVNTIPQPNRDHEVHKEGCYHLPALSNRKYLGSFSNCADVVRVAKITYPTADGCYHCCRPCHNSLYKNKKIWKPVFAK